MPVTYKRTGGDGGDFRSELVHKAGADYVGVSYDLFKGVEMLGCRVWRATGSEGEYHSTRHGLNLNLPDFAAAYHYIQLALDGRYGDADDEPIQCFKMFGNKVFQVSRQSYCGKSLLACRAHLKQKDGSLWPTNNGLTVRPSIWTAILPSVKAALEELLPEWDAIVKMFENSVTACASRTYGSIS